MNLKFQFFGTLQVHHPTDGSFGNNKRRTMALMSYLLLERKQHSRDSLAELFWPDLPFEKGRSNLSVTLSRLTKELGQTKKVGQGTDSYFLSDRQSIGLNPSNKFEIDVLSFEILLLACHDCDCAASKELNLAEWFLDSVSPQLEAVSKDTVSTEFDLVVCNHCHIRIAKAAALNSNELLQGLRVENAYRFEEWLQVRREEYRLIAVKSFDYLTEYYEGIKEFAIAENYCRQQLRLEPYREDAHRQLLRFLSFQGEKQQALEHFQSLQHLFQVELTQPLSEKTLKLHKSIEDDSLAAPQSLSEFLKQAESQNKAQTVVKLEDSFPRNPKGFKLFGRAEELTTIAQNITEGRLVSLIGLGGSGKTSLAIKFAKDNKARFNNRIVFIALETARSSEDILQLLIDALAINIDAKQGLFEQCVKALANTSTLLVLDAVEEVGIGVEILSTLLQACPQLVIIATSRETLNLEAEQCIYIEGLVLPETMDFEEIVLAAPLQLFLKAAQSRKVKFNFDESNVVVAKSICQLLEGLPLAIELAAKWVDVLSLQEIEHEISDNLDFLRSRQKDTSDRHISFRAVFEYAWQSLSPKDQQFMQEISVFEAGFSRAVAKQITTKSSIATMAELVQKALLSLQPNGRYYQHNLIRQFCLEKLLETPELYAQVKRKHTAYYFSFIEQRYDPKLGQYSKGDAVAVSEELINIHAAWRYVVEQGDWQVIADNILAVAKFFMLRSLHSEGVAWFDEALHGFYKSHVEIESTVHNQDSLNKKTIENQCFENKILVYKSLVLYPMGRSREAFRLVSNSLEFFQSLQASEMYALELESAVAQNILGNCQLSFGELESARQHYESALELFQQQDVYWGTTYILNNLAVMEKRDNNLADAKRRYLECLKARSNNNDLRNVALTLINLSHVNRELLLFDEAETQLFQALEIWRDLSETEGVARVVVSFAGLYCDWGKLPKAREYAQEGLELCEHIDYITTRINALIYSGRAYADIEPIKAIHFLKEALQISDARENPSTKANCLCRLVTVVMQQHSQLNLQAAEYGFAALALKSVVENPAVQQQRRVLSQEVMDKYSDVLPDVSDEELPELEDLVATALSTNVHTGQPYFECLTESAATEL